MFRDQSLGFALKTVALAVAFLSLPCSSLAQRGAGGGHTGGGLAGGGGLNGGGGPGSGLDVKDDLKGYHETLSLQATSQQTSDYKSMLAATDRASSELKTFLEVTARKSTAAELASLDKNLVQALQQAMSANTNFLQQLSDRQKTGLKETIKKLNKADSDMAQQTKALDLQVEEAKSAGPQIASSAQGLEHALATFRGQQLDLGDEMSVGRSSSGQDEFTLPPVTTSIAFSQYSVSVTTSGVISKTALQNVPNSFRLELSADMSDLQRNLTQVLRVQIDKSDSCGEQIAIRTAALVPSAPGSIAQVQLHYERWTCFGKGIANEMAEGNGAIEVKLTPSFEAGELHLVPAIAHVDAQGVVGEQLRSGFLGETVRDKIAESVLAVIQQGADYKMTLPPAAQGKVVLNSVRFEGTGSGKLSLEFDGELSITHGDVTALASQLNSSEKHPPALPTDPR